MTCLGWITPHLSRGLGVFLFFTLVCLRAGAADGDLSAAILRIKPSVVAVGTYLPTRNPAFSFRGTGFVVGDGLMVATNAHVLPDKLDSGQSEVLAIARVEEDGRINVRSVSRLASDPAHDLALVRVTGGSPLPALVLEERAPKEGQSIGFTGFPLGAALGMRPVSHRGIISSITPIGTPSARAQDLSANLIRRLEKGFDILQLDATAYPGNSGSPLFDAQSGAVLGVVNMVFVKGAKETALSQPSGITYAIPVMYLKRLIDGRLE